MVNRSKSVCLKGRKLVKRTKINRQKDEVRDRESVMESKC